MPEGQLEQLAQGGRHDHPDGGILGSAEEPERHGKRWGWTRPLRQVLCLHCFETQTQRLPRSGPLSFTRYRRIQSDVTMGELTFYRATRILEGGNAGTATRSVIPPTTAGLALTQRFRP